MKYRRLGNWGVRLSEIGYGSWLTIGQRTQDEADALHRTAYENGINFFDTANVYGSGATEVLVGRALQPFPRDTYVLATKVYFPFRKDWPFPKANDRGLSRKHVYEQCHASLLRLETDYIDLYQCHRFDEHTPLSETCRVFNDLINQGKVLYWGVSEWTSGQITDAMELCHENGWHPPAANQPQYNMLQREWEEDVFPTCQGHGLGIVCFSPLAQGLLTGKYNDGIPQGSRAADPSEAKFMTDLMSDENMTAVHKLGALAAGLGMPLNRLALAWCLRRPEVTSCIIGARTPVQITENIGASSIELDEDIRDRINAILGK